MPCDGHLTLADGAGQWWEVLDPRFLYGVDLRRYEGVTKAAPPPGAVLEILSLGPAANRLGKTIAAVSMLGAPADTTLAWRQADDSLEITVPPAPGAATAIVFRIVTTD